VLTRLRLPACPQAAAQARLKAGQSGYVWVGLTGENSAHGALVDATLEGRLTPAQTLGLKHLTQRSGQSTCPVCLNGSLLGEITPRPFLAWLEPLSWALESGPEHICTLRVSTCRGATSTRLCPLRSAPLTSARKVLVAANSNGAIPWISHALGVNASHWSSCWGFNAATRGLTHKRNSTDDAARGPLGGVG
jgi:hypothetical protein